MLPKKISITAEYPRTKLRIKPMSIGKWLPQLAKAAGKSAFRRMFYSPHWRVGWRFVANEDVWSRGDLGGRPWNVLPNQPFRFFADPFPVVWQGNTWLFFEDFDHRRGKGQISVVAFDADGPAGDVMPALTAPWHLSFPYVFEYEQTLWMLPESSENGMVSLYRADDFPLRWVKELDLITGVEASDSVMVPFNDRLWLFTTVPGNRRTVSDSLLLFHAKSLFGPWVPHLGNPVLVDGTSARSAGRAVLRDGTLWRVVQDCERRYGASLGLARVTRIDDGGFEQKVERVVKPDRHWPGWRLHTLSCAGSLECIDGSALSVRRYATHHQPAQ
jgi:hypothetical protein